MTLEKWKEKVLHSTLDESVNFITPASKGYFEARYVKREPEQIICYLSSQSACSMRCRFCHLTATGQLDGVNAKLEDFLAQAKHVFGHFEKTFPAGSGIRAENEYVNYNFMARGEPLLNPLITEDWRDLYFPLRLEAGLANLTPKYNISTIMPKQNKRELVDMFRRGFPTIYYSLYSADPAFRKKWLPNAMDVDDALQQLADYQKLSNKIVKLHWCFIKDENDTIDGVMEIADKIKKYRLQTNVNIVRYNPYDATYGEETAPEKLEALAEIFGMALSAPVQVVTRVGPDVYASCGQFFNSENN